MTTYQEAEEQFRLTVQELTKQYGHFRIPSDLYFEASNRLRAVALAEANGGSLTRSVCSQNGIPFSVADNLGYTVLEEEPKEKRAEKYGAFEKWATEHAGEQFSSEQLVEVSGFGYQTTLRFIASSPYFHKIKKNLYECRDIKTKHDSE